MKNILKRSCLGFFFCILMLLWGTNLALANPKGVTYAVHVKTSFHTEFNDCWIFDHNSPGALTISDLPGGELLTYAHDYLNRDDENWQATSLSGSIFGIGFHGEFNHHGNEIEGNAVSGEENTFVFKGKRVERCKIHAGSMAQTSNPWSP